MRFTQDSKSPLAQVSETKETDEVVAGMHNDAGGDAIYPHHNQGKNLDPAFKSFH